MSITLDQIILDAQRIANRVKDLEALGNALLIEAEGNNRQIETMKQFQDDIDSLNKLARNKTNAEMVNRVNQQNPSLREFRQENRELKATLEDYQRALELIMHKYREQIQHSVFNSRINFKEAYNAKSQETIRKQQEKINEMAGVMQRVASLDDDIVNEIELLNRLKVENQGLREMLQISKQFGTNRIGCEDKAIQTEEDLIEQHSLLENGDTVIENDKNNTVKKIVATSTEAETSPVKLTEGVTAATILKTTTNTVGLPATITTLSSVSIEKATSTSSSSTTTATATAIEATIVKNTSNLEIEPKKLTPLDISSSVPLVNGESSDCKSQKEVS